jgi:hypothetical protein
MLCFSCGAQKRTKKDISGAGSLLYEHNAMILSGVTSDLVKPPNHLILNISLIQPKIR